MASKGLVRQLSMIFRRSRDKLFTIASLLLLIWEGAQCGGSASVTGGGQPKLTFFFLLWPPARDISLSPFILAAHPKRPYCVISWLLCRTECNSDRTRSESADTL